MITREEFINLGLDDDISYDSYIGGEYNDLLIERYDWFSSPSHPWALLLITRDGGRIYRFRIGLFRTQEQAEQVALTLRLSR